MSINYYGISTELQAIIEATTTMSGIKVLVEKQPVLSQSSPCITISVTGRDPAPNQPLAAGTQIRYNIEIELWLYVYGLDLEKIIKKRNDLLYKLEQLLLGSTRTINGTVETYIIKGGKFFSASRPNNVGLVVAAQTILTAVATAQQ